MKVKSLHEVTRGILTTSGIISIFFLEFLLFSLVFFFTRPGSSDAVLASPVPFGKSFGRQNKNVIKGKMLVMLQRL